MDLNYDRLCKLTNIRVDLLPNVVSVEGCKSASAAEQPRELLTDGTDTDVAR